MKTIPHAFLVILISFLSVSMDAQNNFIIRDPDRTWINDKGTISYAEYILKPMKTHVVCDVYLTYYTSSSKFNANDNYEIYQIFDLPANTLVTDSWLWVDTFIMQAKILERNEAINIYEGIVNRRRDPSLLLKNSATSYSLSIYPVKNNSYRRVKFRFEIPIVQDNEGRSFHVPTSMIVNSSVVPLVTFKITDDNNYEIFTQEDIPLLLTNDSKLGTIYKVQKKPELGEIVFKIKNEPNEPVTLFVPDAGTGDNRGRYQVSFKPSQVFNFETHDPRNIVFLLEHDSLYSNLPKSDVLSGVQEFINEHLKDNDSIQIIYNATVAKKHFPGFVAKKDLLNYSSIKSIKLGNFSALPGSLFEAYNTLDDRSNPVMVIFSSAGNLNSTSHAQSVKDELKDSFGKLHKSFVFSYVNTNAPRVYYANQYHYGNNLFYQILISNSFGYLQWLPTTIKKFELTKPWIEIFGVQFEELTQKPYQIQYVFRPEGGLCFDNIILQNNARGYTQTGKYVGASPFNIDAILYVDNQVFQKTLSIEVPLDTSARASVERYHEGHKILAMEQSNLAANKFKIITASINHRVLSRYTAFLALEPGLQDPCIDCQDESDSPSSTEDESAGVQWKIYPNPFTDNVVIELTGLNQDETILSVDVFDSHGIRQDVSVSFTSEKDKWIIKVEGSSLKAGVYFLKVRLGNRIVTCKLVKV